MSATLDPAPKTRRQKRHARRLELAANRPSVNRRSAADEELIAAFSPARLRLGSLDWIVIVWMVLMHAGAVAAPFFFSWSGLGVALVLHWLTGSIGICLGYHRYLSHKSMKLRAPAKFVTLLSGALSGEGSPLVWAATHRLHHQKSDQEGDPHSPLDGPWWSHIWWLFAARTPAERELLFDRFTPDLKRDPMMMFFERTYFFWLVASGVVLYALGGWSWLLWGLCLRMVAMYHSTWFVNSATHIWGYRNYETKDESRNLWWVAVASYGEGWHNNHHAHPHTARAGHRWWELDPTFWSIRALQAVGLAYDVDDRIPAVNETPAG